MGRACAQAVGAAVILTFALWGGVLTASGQADDTPVNSDRAAQLDRQSHEHSAHSEELSREAAAIATEIDALQAQLLTAAEARSAQERATAAARARLDELSDREEADRAALHTHEEALSVVLAALQRAARADPPALAATPADAAGAARAALLLGHAAPALEANASELNARIDALRGLQASLGQARQALRDEEAALERRRAETRDLITRKQGLHAQLRGEAAREAAEAQALAQEARSVRQLIDAWRTRDRSLAPRLKPPAPIVQPPVQAPSQPALRAPEPLENVQVATAAPAPASGFSRARGVLAPPVLGQVIRGYGAQGPGPHKTGLTLKTAASAQITAPYSGVVAYAEPLLNYRRLLILDVGDGYYIVMIGLGEVHVRTNQMVMRGEPVGEMPASSEDGELYMEVRKHDDPVNPTPWLNAGWVL